MFYQHFTTRALRTAVVTGLAALAIPAPALAFDFTGTKYLIAVTADGQRKTIGAVQFIPAKAGQATFKVVLQTEVFTDHFLSMREFKCLAGAKEVSCYVPYPYPHPATVGPGRLVWLEHSLLFLYKSPAEFGARLTNGVYYEFREQGAALVGRPMAVDLNEISAPPADASVPPYGPAQRQEMDASTRWLRELVIE